MYVTTDVPAGNGVVVRQDGDLIVLRPDLRGNTEWWFYWSVAIRDAVGRRLRLRIDAEQPGIGPQGVALSRDGGTTWQWHGGEDPNEVDLDIGGCDDLRVAVTMPYLSEHWEAFLAEGMGLTRRELAKSAAGRSVAYWEGLCPIDEAVGQLVLTARHHCCESMASFVLEGCVDALLTDEDALVTGLRDRHHLLVVPFIDLDGVEQGDQGKHRAPFDHNRSYDGDHHPETAALRQLMGQAERRWTSTVSLDLHCPFIRSGLNDIPYVVGSQQPANADQQRRFCALLAEQLSGEFALQADDFLPWGEGWNANPQVEQPRSCSAWFAAQPSNRLAATIEIPYGSCRAGVVTAAAARRFGQGCARALASFLG